MFLELYVFYEYPESSIIVIFCILRELYTGGILSLEHTVLRNTSNPLHHELLWYGVCFNAFQIQNQHVPDSIRSLSFCTIFFSDLNHNLPEILSFCSIAISSTFGTKQQNPAQILKDITILHLFLNSQVNFKSLMMGSTQTKTAPQALFYFGEL